MKDQIQNLKLLSFIVFALVSIFWSSELTGLLLVFLIALFIAFDIKNLALPVSADSLNKIRTLFLLRIINKVFLIILIVSVDSFLLTYFTEPSYQTMSILAIIALVLGIFITIPFFLLREMWNLGERVPIGL